MPPLERSSSPAASLAARILAIETSTMTGGVAILDGGRVVGDYRLHMKTTHSERLLATVHRLLNDVGLRLAHLNGIAISIGPGSFTGLRIGLATAKGLSISAGLPLVSVPTLDGLASQLLYCRHRVCPILDAKRKEVYAALYDTSTGELRRISEYMAMSPNELGQFVKGSTVFLGDGLVAYGETLRTSLGNDALLTAPHLWHPTAVTVAQLGLDKLNRGELAEVDGLQPLYLRPSEAERKRRRNA